MICRFLVVPDGNVLIYRGGAEDTYEEALLNFNINPDTVLIYHNGVSLPVDKKIEEEEVEVILTSSRG